MSFLLAHISDVHLAPLPPVHLGELFSKRITGYVNWQRNRAGAMTGETLSRLVSAMLETGPDHIAVTGDLTNLSLDAEFANAADWLRQLGRPADVSAVPGNHDAYVRGALARAVSAWSANMAGDDGEAGFPYLRRRGEVAVIGVNSAVATPPFIAAGLFGTAQAARLAEILDETAALGLYRVMLIHHPPVRSAIGPRSRLYGIRRFERVIARHGAELVLHGHTHLPQRHMLDGAHGGRVPVIGVPAGSAAPGNSPRGAAFNLLHVSGGPGAWTCRLEQHALDASGQATAITDRMELAV
ncbi:metallophosphoesterase family protein [Oricola sp.]|uniref:metallophosphoesterase family protein n=1 Tax=Oricola sp. TaxID=1979950 RepID=UPI003BAD59ED